jgi:hypothetical protein
MGLVGKFKKALVSRGSGKSTPMAPPKVPVKGGGLPSLPSMGKAKIGGGVTGGGLSVGIGSRANKPLGKRKMRGY